MRASRLLRASHSNTWTYTPSIKFIGQRSKLPHEPHAPAPHPAAPEEIKSSFQSFLAKLQSSSAGGSSPSSTPKGQSTDESARGVVGGSASEPQGRTLSPSQPKSGGESKPSKPADYENFWEAPRGLWRQREFTEREIDAVMVRLVTVYVCRRGRADRQSGGATDIRSGP